MSPAGFSRREETFLESAMRSGLVILAEDDEKLRKLYSDALSVHGYTVISASTGKEVLGLLTNSVPRVLILDIMMPGMDGIETCKKARMLLGGGVPILFLTALDGMETVHRCLQAGGDDYLIKGNSIATLLKRVDHWALKRSRSDVGLSRNRALDKIKSHLGAADGPAGNPLAVTKEGS
jgi:two-component system response regulator ResD